MSSPSTLELQRRATWTDGGPTPSARHERPPAPRPAPRPHSARRERAGVAVGLVLIAVVYLVNLSGWPAFADDEGTYYSQAWAVQHLGTLAPYTYWYDHPPLGWLQLAAFTWLPDMLVPAGSSLLAGRIVAVGYAVATALLVYMLGRRLRLAVGWALAAMLFWALSPLTVFEGRQVLLDNVALPWLVGAFVLALNRGRHLGKHMLAGLCFGIAVLSKETMLIFGPALLVAVWQSAYRPTRSFAVLGFSILTTMTGAMYLAYAAVRRELFPGPDHVSLYEALRFQMADRPGSGFVLDADGPPSGAYDTLTSWLDADPYLLVCGVAAAVVALLVRRLRPIGVAVLTAVLVALRPDGYLPGMFVIAMLPFCSLAVAGLLDLVWKRARAVSAARTRMALTATLLLLVAAAAAAALSEWRYTYEVIWTRDDNSVHQQTLERVAATVPQESVLVVDNTMWNDLVDAGRDPDDVVWFYKVDSDTEVTATLGGDRYGVDYLLWSPRHMSEMGPIVQDAYDNSDVVWAIGSGQERVELRQVVAREDEELAQRSLERQDLALEGRAQERSLALPSQYDPDLTNAQVEGIRVDQETMTVPEIAEKYGTAPAVVTEILSGRG